MKIAIHHHKGSFSEKWIEYCEKENIPFKIVNCFASDIIAQLEDCSALMWHHHHTEIKDVLAAKNILFALQHSGKIVFPNFNTGWHFDDKIAQKYLLESLNAPLVPSYVFYDKQTANRWVSETTFPKVFKLKGGSGSSNVILVRTAKEAKKMIRKSFGRGFSQSDPIRNLRDRYRNVRKGVKPISHLIKGVGRIFLINEFSKRKGKEKNYAYFQDYICGNSFDLRIVIIGNRAFGIKRLVRKNDFRASGSGNLIYDKNQIDVDCIKISYDINKKLKSQCIAFDFIYDENKRPVVVEISYGFSAPFYEACQGYWDENLIWHPESVEPQKWMIQDLMMNLKNG